MRLRTTASPPPRIPRHGGRVVACALLLAGWAPVVQAGERAPSAAEDAGTAVLDAGGVAATRAPVADLALDGPVRIGNGETQWGGTLRLDPAYGSDAGGGRCALPYSYGVANRGPGAAGPHAYRLQLEDGEALADDASAGVPAGGSDVLAGTLVLPPGRTLVYVLLDPDDAVAEDDETNNRRRVLAELSGACRDLAATGGGVRSGVSTRAGPRPVPEAGEDDSGVRSSTGTRAGPRPVGEPLSEDDADSGVRDGTSTRSGPRPVGKPRSEVEDAPHRAPPPEGKPAPGGKPAPEPAGKPVSACEPKLSATRASAVTRAGGRISAIAAWEAAALGRHGRGYRWHNARDKTSECKFVVGWSCTVAGRPCKGGP